MPHPNKTKGNRWEHDLSALLGDVKRCTRNGDPNDTGDLTELVDPQWVMEAKDDQSHSLQAFIAQSVAAQHRAGLPWSVVLLKARQRPAGQGYALMHISQWNELRLHLRAVETRCKALEAENGTLARRVVRDALKPGAL